MQVDTVDRCHRSGQTRPMHPEIEAALAPVLRDVCSTAGITPLILDTPPVNDPSVANIVLTSPDGSATGVRLELDRPFVAQVIAAADQVQEWVIEELWAAGRSATWPECTFHSGGHPMSARAQGGEAVWVCPAFEVQVAGIGVLT